MERPRIWVIHLCGDFVRSLGLGLSPRHLDPAGSRGGGGAVKHPRGTFTSSPVSPQSSENIPPGYEVVSLLEALNGPLTPSPAALPLRVLGDPPGAGTLPSYGSDGPLPPLRALSPLDRVPDCGPPGLKLKKSLSK